MSIKISTLGLTSCLLSAIFYLYQFIIKVLPNQCINQIIKDCDALPSLTGDMMSYFLVGYTLAQIPVATMCDKLGPKRSMLVGIGSLSLLSFVQSIATNQTTILVTRFFTGIAGAFALLGNLAMFDRWLPENFRGRSIAIVVTFGMLGGIGSSHAARIAIEYASWRDIFWFLSLMGAILFIVFMLFADDNTAKTTTQKTLESAKLGDFVNWNMAANCLYAWISYLPLEVIGNTVGPKFIEDTDIDILLSPQTCILLGMCVGLFLLGYIADNFGYIRTMTLVGVVNGALMITAAYFPNSLVFLLIGFLSPCSTLTLPFAALCTPRAPNQARGIVNFAQMGGAAIGASLSTMILGYFTQDSTAISYTLYSYQSLFSILGITMILTSLMFGAIANTAQVKSKNDARLK